MMKNCRKALWIVIVLIVVVPTVLFWGTNQIQIYKFRMTKDTLSNYNQLIQSYNEITTTINMAKIDVSVESKTDEQTGDLVFTKQYDSKKQELFEEIEKLSILEYKFPDKYNEIYSLLRISTKNYYQQLYIASETFVPDLSKESGEQITEHYFVSKEWDAISKQLEEWLFDPKYVPNERKLDEIKGKMDELLDLNK